MNEQGTIEIRANKPITHKEIEEIVKHPPFILYQVLVLNTAKK